MSGKRSIRFVAPVVWVVVCLAAAACGGGEAAPSGADASPAPAPAPATTVETTDAPPPPPEAPPPPEPDTAVTDPPQAPPADPVEPAPQPPATTEATDAPASAPEAPAPEPDSPDGPATTDEDLADLEGRWEGGISLQGAPTDLPFAVDLTASGDGLRGTIDIQGFTGLPLSNVGLDAGRIHFEMSSPLGLAVWDGELRDGVIEGDFTQAGMEETFWMQRFEDPSEDPEAARFRREEVTFSNGDIVLAGELTFPEGDGPHPAVVLISGSGDQDRDSDIGGFRLFAVLANHLAGVGVASLRFDDRGVGGSGGDGLQATLQERAGDVEAAVEVLRARDDIAADAVGLVGHSEGGVVAPVVAGRTGVAFVALLAAPAVPLGEFLADQQRALLEESGATAEEVEQFGALQESIFQAVATGQGWDEVEAGIRSQVQRQFEAFPDEMRETIPDEEALVDSIVAEQLATWQSPWFESFFGYDPKPAIVALDVPVIALYGELDTQVPAPANSIAMSEAIAESNIPGYTIATIFSANHLFQEAVTGSIGEYGRLKRRFVPDFVTFLTEWLTDVTGR